MENNNLTGYPSIDKPWLKYYSEEAIKAPLPECSMYEYLFDRNKDHLDDIAINYFGKKITYRKMFEKIDKAATALQALGVKKGDKIGVCVLTSPEAIYLLYAINKIGAVNVLLGFTSSAEDLKEQAASTECKFIFTAELAYSKIVEAAKDACTEKIILVPTITSMPFFLSLAAKRKFKFPAIDSNTIMWSDFLKSNDNYLNVEVQGSETAIIEFTGGSTGTPKGVMISNNAANAFHEQYRYSLDVFNCHRQDKFLCNLPPYIAYCTFACFHNPLCIGAILILYPNPKPEVFPNILLKYKPNHFCCTRLHIDELMKNKKAQKADMSFIYQAIYGGAKETNAWEKQASEFLMSHGCKYKIINGYGMTETSGAFAVVHSDNSKMIPYVKNNVMIINSETEKELKYGEEGEVCVSTPTLMKGYYKNTNETVRTVFLKNGQLWFRSGDIGSLSDDGELKITGRIKRIYCKISKEGAIVRVYPMRIEEVISKINCVEKVAVINQKDSKNAFLSIAFIILKEREADKTKALTVLDKYCRDHLPQTHFPDRYIFVDKFPITRAGKVDYRALEEIAIKMEEK